MTTVLSIFILKFLIFYEKTNCKQSMLLIRDYIEEAEPKEFPFVVSVGRKKTRTMSEEETHFCGGALITNKHVLTAAHCLDAVDNLKEFEVKIGSNDLTKSKKYGVDTWVTFDEWIFKKYEVPEHLRGNDISIITLSSTVGSNIKPALLSCTENNEWFGRRAVTAGWGLRKDGERPRFMEKAILNVLDHTECNDNIKKANESNKAYEVPLRYLCTNAKPYVVLGCGDSGSPLITNNNTIIAVNKSSCPRLQTENVSKEQNLHVGVNYYIDFLTNVTEKTKSKFCCC